MDRHLVDIHWISYGVFGVAIVWNFDTKPTDGATIFWDFKQITYIVKLREKDEKCIGIESRSMGWELRVLTTRPQVLNFEYKVKILLQKIDKKIWPLQNFIFIPLTKASSKNSLQIATSSDKLHCKYLWLNK